FDHRALETVIRRRWYPVVSGRGRCAPFRSSMRFDGIVVWIGLFRHGRFSVSYIRSVCHEGERMSETGWVGPPREHLQLVYDELKAALALQFAELASLDEKAVRLLTPVGVVLGVGVASIGRLGPSRLAEGVFYSGLSILLVSFLAGVYALRLRTIEFAPTAALWPAYATVRPEEMLALECSTVAEVFRNNGTLRGLKSPWIRLQFWALLVGSPILALGFALQVAGILT